MIIDFKYHVVSLVAVFMALGIGIIIGSLLVGESFVTSIIDEQRNLVQGIEIDFLALKNEVSLAKEEIDILEKANAKYEQYARDTMPRLIGGLLNAKKIAVIELPEAQAPGFFLDNLRLSGAEIFLSNRLFKDESPASQDFLLDEPLDALILVNSHPPGELDKKLQAKIAELAKSLEEKGIKVLQVATGDGIEAISEEGLYCIDSSNCVPEQVELILSLAEGLDDSEVEEAAGF